MFCPNCGKEIENGAHFCPFCGNQFNDAAPETPAPENTNKTQAFIEKRNAEKNMAKAAQQVPSAPVPTPVAAPNTPPVPPVPPAPQSVPTPPVPPAPVAPQSVPTPPQAFAKNVPPQAPQSPQAPQAPQGAAPAKKKLPAWAIVLIIVGALGVLGTISSIIIGTVVKHKLENLNGIDSFVEEWEDTDAYTTTSEDGETTLEETEEEAENLPKAGDTVQLGSVSVTIPAGWVVDDYTEGESIEIMPENAFMESVDIQLHNVYGDEHAKEWADNINGNYGGDKEIDNVVIAGKTFYRVKADAEQNICFTDLDDETYLEVSVMFMPWEDGQAVLDAITIK